MFEWFAYSLAFLAVWLVVYVLKPRLRRQMLWVSFFTMFTGLTEPIFVPAYWSPPSLFNLAATTRFDVESLIFSWAVGGLGSVSYEAVLNLKHRKMEKAEKRQERRWLHAFSLLIVPFVFLALYFGTGLNPIYCASLSMLVGASAAVACRPDLAWNTLVGGLLFLGFYFIMFFTFIAVFPWFIEAWNLQAVSGYLLLGVPVEELMFAFTFGAMWSSVYEHVRHYATKPQTVKANS